MNFTHTLAYSKALRSGVQMVDAKFRKLSKMSEEETREALIDITYQALLGMNVSYFVRTEAEIDEMEYEVHMSILSDLQSYLKNEIDEIIRLKEVITF